MSDVEASICKPPCECPDCQHGFYASGEQYKPNFWYQGRLSDHDAMRIVAGHIQNAQQDRQYLLQCLASNADTVVNRWKKKSRDKRRALLLQTIPELCEHRWLIPRYCYMPESKLTRLEDQPWTRRCQLLLHWLSLEVLTMNPAVLFSLLHNRTAYSPQDWATFDGRQLILSWACGHFDVQYSGKCVVMYGPKYGELVDWEAGPAHRADVVGFPKARLILEAQAYLMNVLRKIVNKILEGVDIEKPAAAEKWKIMTKFGFRHTNEVELWSPYTNQAFSAPPAFSIDNLISIAQTRLDAMGDHLWFLQTEPAYMRRYIRLLTQGEFHKTIKKEAASAILTTELFDNVMTYWHWTWIVSECIHVKTAHDRFCDSIHPGAPLPRLYDSALGALELLVVNEVHRQATRFGVIMPHRPGFSHKWTFTWRPDVGSTSFQLRRKPGLSVEQKTLFDEDPLEWCLSQMQAEPDKQTNYDHAIMFAFLENHLAANGPKEKARVDEVLYQKLSDLAACHEMLVSIRMHRPQNRARDMDEVEQSEKRVAWKGRKIPGYHTNEDHIALGTALFRDFYEAPLLSGQKNAAWLSRSQSIRAALEAFWKGLRKTPKLVFELSGFSKDETQASLAVISANLTQEYKDIVHAEQQQIFQSIESARTPTTSVDQKEWGLPQTTQPTALSSKTKCKTRPAQPTSGAEELGRALADMAIDPGHDAAPPQLQVTKRASDMLSLMFADSAAEAARSIDWDAFVHAMADMSFSARNGGGSAVVFENGGSSEGATAAAGGGKIIFHKPHPVAKIDPVMLHAMGRRMAKWFGWRRERFGVGG
ncbi:hypothetical protein MMC34_005847 [Xylographa carneopallida]|nr:hypothetical protein [Xylographa carneopallida]